MILQYSDGPAKLKVATAQRMLYRYRSPGDAGKEPRLNSIGDVKTWQRKKAKGQLAIQGLVANLMDTYLGRVVVTREVYSEPAAAARERLSADFKYQLTADQASAVADVDEDMSREEPMDRLVGSKPSLRVAPLGSLMGSLMAILLGKLLLGPSHFNLSPPPPASSADHRRRGLRQDRGRHPRHLPRRQPRPAGDAARAHHGARPPARRAHDAAVRSVRSQGAQKKHPLRKGHDMSASVTPCAKDTVSGRSGGGGEGMV